MCLFGESIADMVAVFALALTLRSGAFTTMEADHGLAVEIFEDEQMVLGLDVLAPELTNRTYEDVVLVKLVNQFSGGTTPTTTRAEITEANPSTPPDILLEMVSTPSSLNPGESGTQSHPTAVLQNNVCYV